MDQSVIPSVCLSVCLSVSRSVSQLSQSVDQSASQLSQSDDLSVSLSVCLFVCQSVDQSVKHSTSLMKSLLLLLSSNPPVPCPAGMYSLGGRFDNCTACPAGSACPDPAGAPVSCTGGNYNLFTVCQTKYPFNRN